LGPRHEAVQLPVHVPSSVLIIISLYHLTLVMQRLLPTGLITTSSVVIAQHRAYIHHFKDITQRLDILRQIAEECVNTVNLWAPVHQRATTERMQTETRKKNHAFCRRAHLWQKSDNLGSAHLRLLSLRGSSRACTRCCPFSLIPDLGRSVTRTSRTTGLVPFPNLNIENMPPFTACGGND